MEHIPQWKVVRYQYRGNNPVFLARGRDHISNLHWRVYIDGSLQSVQCATFAEAMQFAEQRVKELTLLCPKCGTNVIARSMDRAYRNIDGVSTPCLLCPCGEWVHK